MSKQKGEWREEIEKQEVGGRKAQIAAFSSLKLVDRKVELRAIAVRDFFPEEN